jgi:COMPASS component SWD3
MLYLINHRWTVITIAADKTVKIWHAINGKFERTLEGHSQGISDIAWSSDSQFLCSAADDKTVRIWKVAEVSKEEEKWLENLLSS